MYDFVIIGGGVIGTAIARSLSQYDCQVALIEKEKDVSLGASKANSGIVHGGYAGKHGTLKGELCIKGNEMYDALNEQLNFGFKRIGGLLLGFDEKDRAVLEKQYENGVLVGQKDMTWLTKEAVLELEPKINPEVLFGLLVPSIGITSPYELTIALMENAIENGVELLLDHEVMNIAYDTCFHIETSGGHIEAEFVINAAGLNAGQINRLLNNDQLTIHPRRGQYILFGKDQNHLKHVVFQTPNEKGKGILVTPTVHGNLMIGPDAEDLMDEIHTETSEERLKHIIDKAKKSYSHFHLNRALTTFSGIRAMSHNKDFFIEYVHEHAITVGGIDSPGLTSAPAIAEYVIEMILKRKSLTKKTAFNPYRNSYFDSDNGPLICLCEEQGENRINNAFKGPIPLHTFDAVKRRLRTGMGNCQARRCENKVKKMIQDYYKIDDVKKRTETHIPKRVPIDVIRKMDK